MTRRVEAVFPEFRGRGIIPIDGGWDFAVFEIDGEWIVRLPNRVEVERWLATETAVLAELALTFPVPLPRFELTRGPRGVAYRKLRGEPLTPRRGTASIAAELGAALKVLHAFPISRALELGAKDLGGDRFRAHHRDTRWPQFQARVLPLLARDEREQAERHARAYLEDRVVLPAALIHRDLGPEHVLVKDGRVRGIIDWADVRVGDPAIDFAWLLHGLGDEFASALLDVYDEALDPSFLERTRFYHLLGPFYEVVYGQDMQQPALVESGLAGIRQRLERWPFSG